MNPISLTINQQAITVEPGTSILEAATAAGIVIPTLCFHESLEETGSCWMCIVEIKGKNRFVPACDTPVSEGMVIETENETLHSMRSQSLERIIQEHSGDCIGPCESTCPAGCDIPGFLAAIASGNDEMAIEIIKQTIPLPGILGRICPAPCETECRRHGVDNPLSICALKRYAADKDAERWDRFIPVLPQKTGKTVAIVGSGPTGLTAGYFLLLQGHGVTIFESAAQAGGMMRYGIPRFRLPESVIESDIATLLAMGLEFRFNTVFGKDVTLDTLQKQYDAVLLAIGAQQATTMNIPGEDAPGVVSGIAFLRNAALGVQAAPGKQVVVIGGGNTAIDAARTAIRLGASTVTVLYRRSREEMPVLASEIHEALAEGVTLIERAAPTAVTQVNGALEITAIIMLPGEVDQSGRRRPVPVEGSEFTIFADTIISAIGQKIDSLVAGSAGISIGKYGELQVNPDTLQSETPWLFAGGDCVTGTDTAIGAVEQGKRVAHAINLFLHGEPVAVPKAPFNSSYGPRDEAPRAFYERIRSAARVEVPEVSASERQGSFREVITGYTESLARAEAARCLNCTCNAIKDCRLRQLAFSYAPLKPRQIQEHPGFYKADHSAISMEREKCVDCGICVRMLEKLDGELEITVLTESCPTGALSMPVVSRLPLPAQRNNFIQLGSDQPEILIKKM